MKTIILTGLVLIAGIQFKPTNMQMQTYPVRHLNISINKPASDVYQFVSNR